MSKKKVMSEVDEKALISEIKMLKKIEHVNIVKLFDAFYHKKVFYSVTEYCQGGSLLKFIQNRGMQTERDVAGIMRQIANALSYIHKRNIVHRDLKLDNIMLASELTGPGTRPWIKIVDFGLAQVTEHKLLNKTSMVGTVSYMAP
jgi:serine/threonine protein kinase